MVGKVGGAGALPLLRVRSLSKSFPGLKALDDVSLEVHAGEVVAIVGHNGSGKSTLVKVLAEVHQPDPGSTVEVRDGGGEILSSSAAREELHFIHQDLGLVDTLTTVENLDLARPAAAQDWLPARRTPERRRAQALIAGFGADFSVSVPVGELSAAERAIVAIARALDGWDRPDKVLVLDEPTTAFHGDEVKVLFDALRRIAGGGAGIVFISHRLDEVLGLADRVVALRDGRVVADEPADRLDHHRMVELIAGRAVAQLKVSHQSSSTEAVMEVSGLSGKGIEDLSFSVRAGEILGVSGILGSGRDRLSSLLFGAERRSRGRVAVAGRELAGADMVGAIESGMAFVPADRRRSGAVMDMSARENLTLPRLGTLRRRLWRLDSGAERSEAARWCTTVQLSPPDPQRALKLFSGGNQQKLVLAKWLRTDPRILLLDEPTQGVDVGAKVAIYELIESAAQAGAGVLICSSDTKELVLLCDRVLVLQSGRLTNEVPRAQLSETRLVRDELGLKDDRSTTQRSGEVQVG